MPTTNRTTDFADALAWGCDSPGLPDTARTVIGGPSLPTRRSRSWGICSVPGSRKSSRNGTIFTSFQPAISPVALKDKSRQVRRWRMHRKTTTNLEELAEWINPIVRGWMNYYGEFNRFEMYSFLRRINTCLLYTSDA